MEKKITSTNRINNMVNYTIEEADAALETITETILSEFNAACDKIDAEYES
mgnify:FL=1